MPKFVEIQTDELIGKAGYKCSWLRLEQYADSRAIAPSTLALYNN
ncbi:MAG: hypothetical protein RIE73_23820 [Coleofasciculus sp. C1-SOL-03]|jgi:hypothetical protein